jgi:VanZ family protein
LARQQKFYAVLCVLTVAGILVCTLWPFDFFRANGADWLKSINGIRLSGHGVLIGQAPMDSLRESSPAAPSSLEICIRPDRMESMYTILDIFHPDNLYRFRLQQYYSGLVISHNVPGPNGRPTRAKLDVHDVLFRGKISFITITSDAQGTVVYLDGKRLRSFSNFQISLRDFSGRIAIGNSAFHMEPWSGEVYALAIYPRALNSEEVMSSYRNWTAGSTKDSDRSTALVRYEFSERSGNVIHNQASSGLDLLMPESFMVAQHSYLTSPWQEFEANWSYVWDVLRNIAGFMPFGFLLCAYLCISGKSRRPIVLCILAGFVLSLFVEFVQAYIPQRESGLTDVITNTSGAALGALIARMDFVQRLLWRRGTDIPEGR